MLWSDSTQLTSFGNASLWPIYLFVGNQSKYVRSKTSLLTAQHLAYVPKVIFWYSVIAKNIVTNGYNSLATHFRTFTKGSSEYQQRRMLSRTVNENWFISYGYCCLTANSCMLMCTDSCISSGTGSCGLSSPAYWHMQQIILKSEYNACLKGILTDRHQGYCSPASSTLRIAPVLVASS